MPDDDAAARARETALSAAGAWPGVPICEGRPRSMSLRTRLLMLLGVVLGAFGAHALQAAQAALARCDKDGYTTAVAVLDRGGLVPGRYVLAVGTGAAHKNLAALGAAASMLHARGVRLAIAGRADPAVFRAAGGAEGVALGRVSDAELRALYENATALLFPSRYEGFGLPPVEAVACGCPVVAGRAGAVP